MNAVHETGIRAYLPLPEGSAQYPPEFIEAHGVIKLREGDALVEIGVTEKTGGGIKNTLRNFHRKPAHFVPIDTAALAAYLGTMFGEADGAPVINLVNSICIEGIHSGASDIHLESAQSAAQSAARVRYRIDGALRTVRTVEPGRFPAIASRIKSMANLNILERRLPQDGRITVSMGKERVDLRVSIVPVRGGESIVLRILGKKAAVSSLSELGLAPDQLVLARNLLSLPHGLILTTGPTGSGKTTTLNAMLGELVSERVKIITIEDPVELVVNGVNQIQTNEHIGLGFDTILRRVLRQDPNVIMIGELRDSPTAEIALRAALTGHLVLSTLHTNDAVSAIPRLFNMGIEPYLIASVLRGVMAQRLVRTICPYCKETAAATAEEARLLERAGIDAAPLYRGAGCPACNHTGFRGRALIAELFSSDPGLEDLILAQEKASALEAYLARRGMKNLLYAGLRKAAEGVTTVAEAAREAQAYFG